MQKSNSIQIVGDGSVPVVIGDCPSCGSGDRSMILIDYVPNMGNPENSMVYLRCMCCSSIHQRKIKEVAEGS
jgi:hypothetical protein